MGKSFDNVRETIEQAVLQANVSLRDEFEGDEELTLSEIQDFTTDFVAVRFTLSLDDEHVAQFNLMFAKDLADNNMLMASSELPPTRLIAMPTDAQMLFNLFSIFEASVSPFMVPWVNNGQNLAVIGSLQYEMPFECLSGKTLIYVTQKLWKTLDAFLEATEYTGPGLDSNNMMRRVNVLRSLPDVWSERLDH